MATPMFDTGISLHLRTGAAARLCIDPPDEDAGWHDPADDDAEDEGEHEEEDDRDDEDEGRVWVLAA